MTPEQEREFANYGCACRCLLALANSMGKKISKENFIDDYSKRYPFWEAIKRCGVTDTGLILDLIRELGIGKSFQVFLSKKEVRDRFQKRAVIAALLFTEKKREENGTYSDYFHCNLVVPQILQGSQANTHFALVPLDDITPMQPGAIEDSEIDRMAGYFLLIY